MEADGSIPIDPGKNRSFIAQNIAKHGFQFENDVNWLCLRHQLPHRAVYRLRDAPASHPEKSFDTSTTPAARAEKFPKHFDLSTHGELIAAFTRQPNGHAGDAFDVSARVGHRIHGASSGPRRENPAWCPVIQPAGQLPYDDHVRCQSLNDF